MTTYPADAIEDAKKAFDQAHADIHSYTYGNKHVIRDHSLGHGPQDRVWEGPAGTLEQSEECTQVLNNLRWSRALAAFDAAMLVHGWKRVRVYTQADLDAAEREAEHLLAVFETDATPEVKP